jgi:hypothetical protein
MSIVRVGLSQTKKFATGYDAIFAKKARPAKKPKGSVKKKAAKSK